MAEHKLLPTYFDDELVEQPFKYYAAREPRLARVERRIKAIKRKNFEIKGTWQLGPMYAQALWYGANGLDSVEWQITECVGRESDQTDEELRSDVAHSVCYRHLWNMFAGKEPIE